MTRMRFSRRQLTLPIPQLALPIIVALLVAYEAYAVFIKTEGQTGFLPGGADVHLTSEVAGDGVPLVLEFAMRADGLEAIDLYPHAAAEPAEGQVTFTLLDQVWVAGLMRYTVPVVQSHASAADVAAATPYRLRLPRIDASAGRHYRLEIALTGARPGHGLRFEAGWPIYGDARMLFGVREEWGDLKFQTVAERTTIARTLTKMRRTAPPILKSSLFWIVFLVLFNWALAIIIRDLGLGASKLASAPDAEAQTRSANRR
jgi:hypothetical protein